MIDLGSEVESERSRFDGERGTGEGGGESKQGLGMLWKPRNVGGGGDRRMTTQGKRGR